MNDDFKLIMTASLQTWLQRVVLGGAALLSALGIFDLLTLHWSTPSEALAVIGAGGCLAVIAAFGNCD